MGEWLGDTLEAVEFTATKVEQARAAPKLVMREMHAYALGLADETGELLRKVQGRAPGQARSAGRAPGSAIPPASNTGGKGSPGKGAAKGRGGRS
jgi:hypothetical protein